MATKLDGSTTATFAVTLSVALEKPVSVKWHTEDGTGKAGVDYEAASGELDFAPGETSKAIQVVVYGVDQAVPTSGKTFRIRILPPADAIVGNTLTECTIVVTDEEGTPVTTVKVATGPEGGKGSPGLSAYELAKLQGYEGTLENWMNEIANAQVQADRAEAAVVASDENADRAEIARDAAEAKADSENTFPDTAAGIAGTTPGKYFRVPGGASAPYSFHYYRNNAGVAELVTSQPSESMVVQAEQNAAEAKETATTVDRRTGGFRSTPESVYPYEMVDTDGKTPFFIDDAGVSNMPGGSKTPTVDTKTVIVGNSKIVQDAGDRLLNAETDLDGRCLWGTYPNTGMKEYMGEPLHNFRGLLPGDFCAVGDSITAMGEYNGSLKPVSWHKWASLLTNCRLRLDGIYGTGGAVITTILQTHIPQAVAAGNTFCVLMAGRNDIGGNVDLDGVTIPAFNKAFLQLRQGGIIPVVCTMAAQGIPSNTLTTAQRTAEHKLNNWLRAYARLHKLPFVDLHKVTADPATGNWLPGYSIDISHPTETGAKAMGQALADALADWTAKTYPTMAEEQLPLGITSNAMDNALFLTNNGTVPDGWTVESAGESSFTTDPGVKGNVWKIRNGSWSYPIVLVPGKKMGFGLLLKSNADISVECYIASGSAASTTYLTGLRTWNKTIEEFHYSYGEFIVPAGITQGTVVVRSGGAVDLFVGQMGLFTITEITEV